MNTDDPVAAFIDAATWHGTLDAAEAILAANGGKVLAEFAGNGNTDGVRELLDLGVAVDALLKAGASVAGVQFPSGYAEVDELLRSHHA